MKMSSVTSLSVWMCLLFLRSTVIAKDEFTSTPSSALTIVEGKVMNLTWTLKMGDGGDLYSAKVRKYVDGTERASIFFSQSTQKAEARDGWVGRKADLSLNAIVSGTTVTIRFALANLNKNTDEAVYELATSSSEDSKESPKVSLTINVPPSITSSHPYTIAANETQTVQLVCNATGFPTPTVNWTRNGVLVGTGSPFSIEATPQDHERCYTCVVFNGVYEAKTANVCLSVQYKPYGSHGLTFDRTSVCQNDTVNVTCKSGPSNPEVSAFKFYYGEELVQSGSSNSYISKAIHGAPAVNKFTCVPGNLLGYAVNNVSGNVIAKVKPAITKTTSNPVVAEGSNVNLACNVSGTPNLTVKWTRIGKPDRLGNVYSIGNIKRIDEGLYRCTVDNGVECPTKSATINVTVNFKPESTSLSSRRSNNTFLRGENVTLLCSSLSKPQRCNVTFYNGSNLIARYTGMICDGSVAARHVIPYIDGCGWRNFSCKADNEYGSSGLGHVALTINVPATINTTPAVNVVVLKEGSSLDLNCSTTGCPEPNISWTKQGHSRILGSRIGGLLMHRFSSLAKGDTGTYTCTVDNSVVGSPIIKSIYVNVTYTPYRTKMTSTHTRACLNDSITLNCTTNSNPAVHDYRFYLNEQVIHTSSSGIYTFHVAQSGNNTYKCEPINEIGPGVNATLTIITKDPPAIMFSSPSDTFIEGTGISLECNVTGTEPLSVSWRKIGGASFAEGSVKQFSSVSRHDEGEYQCTARNGDECPVAIANSTVTVIYKPENISLSSNASDIIMSGDPIELTCRSSAKPKQCQVQFFQGQLLIANISRSTCSETHVISNINGCNQEAFWCVVENEAGRGERVFHNVTVQVPAKITLKPMLDTVIREEGQALSLNCTSTGCPTPNITWTKQGISQPLGTTIGSFLIQEFNNLLKSHTGYYKCSTDNGVAKSDLFKQIYLNVTYKPYNTNMTSTHSRSCLNDQVTLSCITNANPEVHEYRFYLNEQVIHTSSSGIYTFPVAQSGNNTYKCEPKNRIGYGANATVVLLTKDPPKIIFSSPNKTFIEGQRVSLVCNVTGSEMLNVTWRRIGSGSHAETPVKQFLNISRHDEAVYQCITHNGDECPMATASAKITVIYKPENTALSTSTKVACHNDKMTLNCTSHAKPNVHSYKFYRNGVFIANSSNGLYTYNMTVNGTNVYTCIPENNVGPGANDSVTVQVKVTPKIRSITASQDVVEGSSLTLVCDVWDNSGKLNVSWHNDGGGLISNTSTYTFNSIQRSQTGSFVCHATNGNECEATSKKTVIKVTYQPKITQSSDQSQTIDENDNIVLTCKANGYPTPTITWTKDGASQSIHTGETFVVKATPSTKGKYKCSVSNGVGQTQMKEFTVNVIGYCDQHQCRSGTTCVSSKKSYFCNCTSGLAGRFCEKEDSISTRFEVNLVFSKPTWNIALKDKTSKNFQDIEKIICDAMGKIFGSVLLKCSVISFSKGSLDSKVDLQFKESKLESMVEKAIKDAAVNGTKLSDNLILKNSGTITASIFGTACSKEPCKYDGVCKEEGDGYKCECKIFRHGENCEKGIGMIPGIIIIVACFLLIIIVLVLLCLYCRRNKSNSYEKDIAESATKMEEIRYTSTKDHVAASENYSFEEEYLRKGRYMQTS